MARKFLTAEWRKLVFANYEVEPLQLQPYVPPFTELDTFNGKHYVSVVGFMFRNVKVLGTKIPFHVNFPEINLRFYVRRRENGIWKRGVVFIKEIVSKPMITWTANALFNEHYQTLPTTNEEYIKDESLHLSYSWKFNGHWNKMEATARSTSYLIEDGSEEEFISQHFWGYSIARSGITVEYEVAHPKWEAYPVTSFGIDCDFSGLYGKSFASLSSAKPASVMAVEGSDIVIFNKKLIMEN